MRVYGRVPADPLDPDGEKRWVVVQTTPRGYNDDVYICAMAQTLKLNLNESPFWGNYGIPAHASVMQQIAPDFYVIFTQNFYSRFFASLIISKDPYTPNDLELVYRFSVVTNYGFKYPEIRVRGAPQ
jgi:hypothetical protein